MSDLELKPKACPFCAKPLVRVVINGEVNHWRHVMASSCILTLQTVYKSELERWNTRPTIIEEENEQKAK